MSGKKVVKDDERRKVMKEMFISEKDMPKSCANCWNTGCIYADEPVLKRKREPTCKLNSLEQHDKEVEKRVAKEILQQVADGVDKYEDNYCWLDVKRLAEKYGVEVN